MKFSEKWLREWVNPAIGTQELMDQITMAGLEVDGFEPVAGAFTGVIVGEVLSVEPHPDADKLRVCQVAGGDETVQVVCGAPNVREGLKVPFAVVGRSEEHTSELQSRPHLVCRLLLDTATTEISTLSLHDALPIWL